MSFAGPFTDTIVATQEGGVNVHLLISKGITEKLQSPNGPVVLIEAGVLVEPVTEQNGNMPNDQERLPGLAKSRS